MKMMKKYVSIILSLILLLGVFSSVPISAGADPSAYYTIDKDPSMTGGSVDISELGSVSPGEIVTVTAQPDADRFTLSLDVKMWDGSHNFTVSVPGLAHVDRNTVTFPMPESDVMVFASFTGYGYYSAFIRDMAHGTVIADPELISGADGTDVTLTIRPENGYRYIEDSLRVWRDNGEELFEMTYMLDEITENSVYSITCFSNIEVYAEFEEAPSAPAYSVNIDGNIEHGSVVSDLESAEEGWTVTLTASSEEHSFFELQSVTVTKESGGTVETTGIGGGSYTFIMPAEAVDVSAVFAVPVHPVTIVNSDPEGTGCSVLDNNSYMAVEWSDTVSLTVNIFENCAMDSIVVTGDESGSVISCALDHHSANSAVYYYRFVMPNEPVTVSAIFSVAQFNITVDQTVLGDVIFNVDGIDYDGIASAARGDEVLVTYTADTIKYISSLTYTYTSVTGKRTSPLKNQTRDGNVYTGTFTMLSSDVKFGVTYDKPYEIIIDDASFASMNVWAFASSYRADEGDKILVELVSNDYGIPAPAWRMTYTDETGEHEVDFEEISARSREYIMPASNVTVSADPDHGYEVSPVWVTGGGLTPSHETAKFGQTVTLTVAPDNSGYETLLDVYYYDMYGYTAKVGLTHTSSNTYTFTMPAARVYIELKCYNYVDRIWNGSKVEESYEGQADYIRISHLSPNADTFSNGWYYLDENRTFDKRLQISGTVYLILEDGKTLTCTKGIRVPEGAVLHVYGQKADSGRIVATAGSYEAAIGSNDQDDGDENGAGSIYIHGGNISATGGSDAAGIGGGNEAHGGSVRIYGGTVIAVAGTDAAGIGSGDEYEGNHVFDIKIYGGTVTATGGECGAGIGGGDNVGGGSIRIYGGSVTANGGKYAAGIGGGEKGYSGDIIIRNATVSSGSEYEGAGIGGGKSANSGIITISNSKLDIVSGYFGGAGIGGGQRGTNGNITISDSEVTVLTQKLNKGLNGQGAGIGAGMGRNQTGYIDICRSDIFVETANGPERGDGGAAAIGGGDGGNGGYIYIRESNITACAYGGAGIGGGDSGECGTVEITSSKVIAVSACRGAGIGGGDCKGGGTIKITDSEVTAIGGCSEYLPTNLVKPKVTSKTAESWYYLLECIILTSTCRGAGIGGGDGGNGSNVTITNSRVIASSKNGSGARAIGRGKGGSNDGTLTIIGSELVYTGSTQKKNDEYIFIVSGKAISADRVSVCQTSNMVMIDVCSHPNTGYTVTPSSHTLNCIYCGASVTEEHSFDASTHICICGYEYSGDLCRISFFAGDSEADGTMNMIEMIPGSAFELPVCGFSAPQGKIFKEWSVSTEGNGPESKLPGDTVTIIGDTSVTAVWESTACVHEYGEPVWIWATDLSSAEAVVQCVYCDEEKTASTNKVTYEIAGDKIVYTASVIIDGVKYTGSIEFDLIFTGHNISINGDIGLNFFIDVPDDIVKEGKAVVEFSWIVNGEAETSSYTVKPADKTENGYMAVCEVSAAEMTCEIYAAIVIGGTETCVNNIFSVKQYADTVLYNDVFKTSYISSENDAGRNGEERYGKLVHLVESMLDYGAKAQWVFDVNTDSLANDGVDVESYEVTPDMINSAISEANPFITPISMRDSALASYGIEYKYSSLVFLSKTSLRHYYRVTDMSLYEAAKADGSITGANERHLAEYSYIYFEFAAIPAPELADYKALTIGGKTYYSAALSYSRVVIASGDAPANEKALAMASYRYYVKAKAFFG